MTKIGYFPILHVSLILTQNGESITGTSLGGGPYPEFTITEGTVIGNDIDFLANYNGIIVQFTGLIAPDGSASGTWKDIAGGSRIGTWTLTSGSFFQVPEYALGPLAALGAGMITYGTSHN